VMIMPLSGPHLVRSTDILEVAFQGRREVSACSGGH